MGGDIHYLSGQAEDMSLTVTGISVSRLRHYQNGSGLRYGLTQVGAGLQDVFPGENASPSLSVEMRQSLVQAGGDNSPPPFAGGIVQH